MFLILIYLTFLKISSELFILNNKVFMVIIIKIVISGIKITNKIAKRITIKKLKTDHL